MRAGASLFLIAVGAILTWAVTKSVQGVDLKVVGVILMVIGAIGLVIEMALYMRQRRTVVEHRAVAPGYIDPAAPRY